MPHNLMIGHDQEHVVIDWTRADSRVARLTVEQARHVVETINKYADDLEETLRTGMPKLAPIGDKPTFGCPECGRQKARSVQDVLDGCCPKWYMIRDPDAEADCHNHAQRIQLNIEHPKPAPRNDELASLVDRDICRAGGGSDDSVYGFRFTTREEAQAACAKVRSAYPKAICTIETIRRDGIDDKIRDKYE